MGAWTNERTEQAKTLWTQGRSASLIAAVLGGVTRSAVIGKMHRLGLTRSYSPNRIAAAGPPLAKAS